MPVITPGGFTFAIQISKLDSSDQPIQVVKANNSDKYKCEINLIGWDGNPFQTDTTVQVCFSDGRDSITHLIPWDVGYNLEIKSATVRTVEVTIIDKTTNSDYFIRKSFQFSPVS